ncbi:MAG: glycine/betaine ABC transporter, partial [Hyphomicrobiales bacterium]
GRIVQIGTPEEIILNPVDEYVSDFVAGISKLNMIFAHSVMHPVDQFTAEHGDIPKDAQVAHPKMDLSDLMGLCVDGHGIVAVSEGGKTVGVINRAGLIRAIQTSQA